MSPAGPSLPPATTTCDFLVVSVHVSDLGSPSASPDLPFSPSQVTTLTGHQAYPAATGLWWTSSCPAAISSHRPPAFPITGPSTCPHTDPSLLLTLHLCGSASPLRRASMKILISSDSCSSPGQFRGQAAHLPPPLPPASSP